MDVKAEAIEILAAWKDYGHGLTIPMLTKLVSIKLHRKFSVELAEEIVSRLNEPGKHGLFDTYMLYCDDIGQRVVTYSPQWDRCEWVSSYCDTIRLPASDSSAIRHGLYSWTPERSDEYVADVGTGWSADEDELRMIKEILWSR